jgi:hypothetical protein
MTAGMTMFMIVSFTMMSLMLFAAASAVFNKSVQV